MSRIRWSFVGFILSVGASLSLVAQWFLAYSSDPTALAVAVCMALLPFGAAVTVWPVAARPGRGRAAAICALVSVGALALGYLVLFTTPKDQGFPFGVGLLMLPAYPTLLVSSLLAWLAERGEEEART